MQLSTPSKLSACSLNMTKSSEFYTDTTDKIVQLHNMNQTANGKKALWEKVSSRDFFDNESTTFQTGGSNTSSPLEHMMRTKSNHLKLQGRNWSVTWGLLEPQSQKYWLVRDCLHGLKITGFKVPLTFCISLICRRIGRTWCGQMRPKSNANPCVWRKNELSYGSRTPCLLWRLRTKRSCFGDAFLSNRVKYPNQWQDR